jgi:AbrB family looped-hinge helix DNA binding protein
MTKELMMSTLAVRVQEKGQVTIPLEIRRKLNLKQGDMVTFVETENGIIIKPAEVIVSEALDEIGRVLKTKGISLEGLIERGREIRGEIVEEEYGITDTKSQ